MSDLSPRARAILDIARAADRSPGSSSEAVRAALTAWLGPLAFGPPPAPGPITGPGGGAAAAPSAGILAKVIAAIAVLGATLTGGILIGRATAPSQSSAPPASSAEVEAPPSASAAVTAPPPPPPTTTAMAAPPPAQPDPPHAAVPPARSREAPDRRATAEGARLAARDAGAEPSPPAQGGSLADEASILREAHLSLRGGDAEGSLKKLDELASRHPDGVLREERMALRIFALCASGKPALARAEADRFLEASPRSPLSERVRASCAFAPRPTQKRE